MDFDPPRILLVDDEEDVRELLQYYFEQRGYQVCPVDDHYQALREARRFEPDLILLDFTLPETDGDETCRALRRAPLFRQVPIVFLTARAEPECQERAFAAGATAYITKPITPRELMRQLGTYCRKPARKSVLIS